MLTTLIKFKHDFATSTELIDWLVSSVQVVLPYYEKYSAQIDKMMSEAATSAEGIIKSAVDTLETEEAKQEWGQ